MAYLLDTHTFLWFLEGNDQLSDSAKQAIEDRGQFKYVSIISFWEIAIKISLKKLDLTVPEKELKIHAIKNGFEILPLTFDHTSGVVDLPLYHRDPFDRMIISQALTENLTVITRDQYFDSYPVHILW